MTKLKLTRKPRVRKASTNDILASSERRVKVPRKWQAHYKNLVDLRDHLARERRDLQESAREEALQFSQHIADAATDSYDRDWALGMLSSEQNALYEIEQAIDRIRDGTYGKCELTGKPISDKRLRAIPWTRFSAEAEKQIERDGRHERRRIGEPALVPRETTESQVGEEQER